jgi:hypothetical protein
MQKVGLDRWPRFLAAAAKRSTAAISDNEVPGVVRASATDVLWGAGGLIVGGLILWGSGPTPKPPPAPVRPVEPIILKHSEENDKKPDAAKPASDANARPADTSSPDKKILTDDRRRHILDGEVRADGTIGGGHRPGMGFPGKTEFPKGWSDDRIIDAITDVANDPKSTSKPMDSGRTRIESMRDGIDIRVVIDTDDRSIVTGYPTDLPRNPHLPKKN